MSTRMKYLMKAPADVTESIIQGTYYWPDENCQIETTNAEHVKELKRHGYEVVGEVAIMRPAAQMGSIEVDEMGRSQLAEALEARGLSFPDTAPRDELAALAIQWNSARIRRTHEQGAAAPAKTEAPAPAPASVVTTTVAAEDAPDFSTMDSDAVKAWLTSKGVAFNPKTPPVALRRMAAKAHQALTTAERKAG